MSAATITALRDLVPIRPLTFIEAYRIAELQANKLLVVSQLAAPPVPTNLVAKLPKVQVEHLVPLPMAGATQWSHGRWLILINGASTNGRQRFTLMHEFKHILDNPFIDTLYPPTLGQTSDERAEHACDFFAAAVLMPRRWVKKAWAGGLQDVRTLSHRFDVSHQAMERRLVDLGLIEPPIRCATTVIRGAA